uniref:Uncharacterized protein n=1 Tax=Glossina palpalis gambiensis TaxID=67801 RepID=A0A1B0BE26_9MUSC
MSTIKRNHFSATIRKSLGRLRYLNFFYVLPIERKQPLVANLYTLLPYSVNACKMYLHIYMSTKQQHVFCINDERCNRFIASFTTLRDFNHARGWVQVHMLYMRTCVPEIPSIINAAANINGSLLYCGVRVNLKLFDLYIKELFLLYYS